LFSPLQIEDNQFVKEKKYLAFFPGKKRKTIVETNLPPLPTLSLQIILLLAWFLIKRRAGVIML